MLVHVAAFYAPGQSGGFDWFLTAKEADERVLEWAGPPPAGFSDDPTLRLYRFSVNTDADTRDAITEEIDGDLDTLSETAGALSREYLVAKRTVEGSPRRFYCGQCSTKTELVECQHDERPDR